MHRHKYSRICNLWGKFLHSSMICTTRYNLYTSGEKYLHAKMFCTLARTSSIPMDAINVYMQERFEHPPIQLLYPCLRCIYLQGCSVHSPYFFYSNGGSKFLHARTFFTLADTTFIPMFVMYLPARMFCTLTVLLLFPWVQ